MSLFCLENRKKFLNILTEKNNTARFSRLKKKLNRLFISYYHYCNALLMKIKANVLCYRIKMFKISLFCNKTPPKIFSYWRNKKCLFNIPFWLIPILFFRVRSTPARTVSFRVLRRASGWWRPNTTPHRRCRRRSACNFFFSFFFFLEINSEQTLWNKIYDYCVILY